MRVESGKQSNHGSFIVPEELGDENCSTLHEYVARWLLITRKYACCDDIANAFGISRRQASNIIYNIHRKHADMYLLSMKRIKEGKGNVVKTWLKIESINPVKKNKKRAKNILPTACESAVDVQSIAHFFLRRKTGESCPASWARS
ncbi:CaiF/GrlA family transcriptional regulator [Ewingella americana]|uniref:CaiF/GrlA family transcriptional regulator n=1 Tax=Ewingella americana TaxID=41202 RepID=UPI0012AE77E6|nr:CaiF/GrlA family transcriptional regulator [Ewingella americana]MRT05923.1 CaiF/GrlA family transcriptional regulator [Ewingella americana]